MPAGRPIRYAPFFHRFCVFVDNNEGGGRSVHAYDLHISAAVGLYMAVVLSPKSTREQLNWHTRAGRGGSRILHPPWTKVCIAINIRHRRTRQGGNCEIRAKQWGKSGQSKKKKIMCKISGKSTPLPP